MNDLAIHTEGLVKSFGKTRAVDGLDLKVPRGSVYGFLGRNGAGKTTTVKTLLGLLRPSAGAAQVLGFDIGRDLIAILERTGFVPENKMLFGTLTPAQIVHFNQGYFPKWSSELVARYADLFEIPMQTPFSKLSLGNKTKVCHLLALCQGADLLILDEPSIGLDPVITDLLLRVLVEDHVSEGKTVFLSSHQLAEVERIADCRGWPRKKSWMPATSHGKRSSSDCSIIPRLSSAATGFPWRSVVVRVTSTRSPGRTGPLASPLGLTVICTRRSRSTANGLVASWKRTIGRLVPSPFGRGLGIGLG